MIKGKRKWIASGGFNCPYCGADDIGTYSSENCIYSTGGCDTVDRACEMECQECGGRWKVECAPVKVTEILAPKPQRNADAPPQT